MNYISKEQIILLHDILIEQTGGIKGISDEELVDIILSVASGKSEYPDLLSFVKCHLV